MRGCFLVYGMGNEYSPAERERHIFAQLKYCEQSKQYFVRSLAYN